MSFSLSYPYWYVALCLLFGALLAFGLYFKNKNFTSKLSWVLSMLRFATGSVAAFLLLNPVLKWMQEKKEVPTIVILQDNSKSQLKAFEKINKVQYQKQLQEEISKLKEGYEVKEYTYGNQLNDTAQTNYKDNFTNISKALELINSTYDNGNLGAIVVTGDGIFNQGTNPTNFTATNNASIYAIGLGDTTLQKDALVSRVYANKVVYLGDKFNIKADLLGFACSANRATIKVVNKNNASDASTTTTTFTGARSNKQVEFILNANKKGIQQYSVTITGIDNENNTTNNTQDFYVEVIDSKQKIGIICNSPHPDINALQEVLTNNKNNEVTVFTADKINGVDFSNYNLLVLHNLPSNTNNLNNILALAKKNNIGLLFVVGSQTNLSLFNAAQNALQIKTSTGGNSDVLGIYNKNFSLFTVNLEEAQKISSLPPLSAVFGSYNLGSNTSVLFNQKLGSVTTNNALWVLQQNSNSRLGIIPAEGLWRWRLYDFVQHKNHALVDGFIEKTIQYLVVKQDKKQFRTSISKTINTINDEIAFTAELYNDNYELINTGEVSLTLVSNAGVRYSYNFNKLEKGFSINIGTLPTGVYSYEAKSIAKGVVRTSVGSFSVADIDIENSNTTADFNTLYQLANNNNGKFLYHYQTNSLADLIKQNKNIKNILKQDINTEPLINWKWLFGILMGLLGLEWFLRKRSGGY